MRKEIMRVKGNEFCRLEVELKDGRLSICGTAGDVVTAKQARQDALRYWKEYFAEDWNQIEEMNERCGSTCRTPAGAARYVVENDGEYHGLDVISAEGDKVFIAHSGGQIVEELRKWFPEACPYLKWHLNDMKAECVHQEARGETWTTNPSAVCPDCGHKLGSAWLKRELPPEVVTWFESLDEEAA